MATKGAGANRYYTRTTNLPTFAAHTMMGWARVDSNRECGLMEMQGGIGPKYLVGVSASGVLQFWNGSTGGSGSTLTTGTWYHVAMRVNGTGASAVEVYLNGTLDFTANGNGAATASAIWFANDDASSSEWFNGAVAAWKVWDAVLSADEIRIEARQIAPVRFAGLNGFYPLFSITDDEVDYSTLGRTLTVGGTFSSDIGPPCKWKIGRGRTYSFAAAAAPSVFVPAPIVEQHRRQRPNAVAY